MTIKILGSRGEIPLKSPKYTKHSGILIDNFILVDVGEAEYLSYNPKLILITHFHPDHAFFARGNEKIKLDVPVYAPENNKNAEGIQIIHEPFEKDGYRITPIPTIHSLKLKSQGYLIEKDNKRLFYSGDLIRIEKKHQSKLNQLDLVITEGSFIKKGGLVRRDAETFKLYGHTGIPDLVKLFKKYTNHIVFTHFGTWFLRNINEGKKRIEKLEEDHLQLETAFDGKIIRV